MKEDTLNEVRSRFERDGAVILPGFFEPRCFTEVNAQLGRYLSEPTREKPSEFVARTYTDVQAWAPVEAGVRCFTELRDDARLRAVTDALLGPGWSDEQSLVMLTRRGKAQAWHQDTASSEPGQFIVNRLIYTRETPADAGALVFVPGSHRMGRIPVGGPHDAMPGERLIAPAAGTLALVHSRCFHRVTANQTDFARFSINFRVRPASAPPGLTTVGVYRTAAWNFATGKEQQR